MSVLYELLLRIHLAADVHHRCSNKLLQMFDCLLLSILAFTAVLL